MLALAVVGAGLEFSLAVLTRRGNPVLYDFKGGLYDAGTAILHGHDPYQAGFLAHQAAIMRGGGIALGETAAHTFSIPVYPAPANLAVVPFSALPFWLAGVLFTILSIGAMIVALRLLDVRDWHCYALALISWPFLFSLDLGAVGPILLLGCAVVWRTRDRLWPPAIALAAIVVAKLFPWPLALWLLITKRFRALALAVALGVAVTVLAWATIGFAGLAQYPQMLSNLSYIQEARAVSLVAVLLAVGVPGSVASALALAAAGALLLLAWRFASRPDGDRRAFGLAVMAALTASPIVWDHYMVLLFVPIALLSPRFSAWWFVPLSTPFLVVLSALIVPLSHGLAGSSTQTIRDAIAWLAVEALVIGQLCRRPPKPVPQTAGARSGKLGRASALAGEPAL